MLLVLGEIPVWQLVGNAVIQGVSHALIAAVSLNGSHWIKDIVSSRGLLLLPGRAIVHTFEMMTINTLTQMVVIQVAGTTSRPLLRKLINRECLVLRLIV